MKRLFLFCSILFLCACKNKDYPDVSNINVPIKTIRFEKDFFNIDTNNITEGIQKLYEKYPSFTEDFLTKIIGSKNSQESIIDVRNCLRAYRFFYDSTNVEFVDFKPYEVAIKHGLQFVKYYFPKYELPTEIITYIGPWFSYGDIITQAGLAVGLHLHMGENFPVYQTGQFLELYPPYLVKNFVPQTIAINCMKNVISDLYPQSVSGKSLLEQMIEEGKKIYLLKSFLPETATALLLSYTPNQLNFCNANEKNIWEFFVQNNLLYETEPSNIMTYTHDGPNTPEFGVNSPGHISLFIGYRIVEKWMHENKTIALPLLLTTPANQIFNEVKYKP